MAAMTTTTTTLRKSLTTFFVLLVVSFFHSTTAWSNNAHHPHQRTGGSLRPSSILYVEHSTSSDATMRIGDRRQNEQSHPSSPQNTRRYMLSKFVQGSTTTVAALLLAGRPQPAAAVYGVDAKMSFPDPIQGLADRNGKQCLVESLGNRECLVYREDEEKLLYKGADVTTLLSRVQAAAQALDRDIPPLVESKKWTQFTGVLTGPMGQLSSTLALLEKLAENPALAKQKAQIVKQDIFAIGTAVTNKQGDGVLKYRALALEDLAVFLKAL